MYRLEDNQDVVSELTSFMNDNREARGVLMATLLKTQEVIGYIPEEIISLIDEVLGVPASRIDNLVHYYSFFKTVAGKSPSRPSSLTSTVGKTILKKDIKGNPTALLKTLDQGKTLEEYLAKGGLQALVKALGMISTNLVQQIKDSGYKGRGDGGYVTGLKWELTANVDDPNKGIICNGDSLNRTLDRKVLQDNPFKLIEAIVIAGYGVSANKGYIYTQDTTAISQAISDAYSAGILGKHVLGTDFSFELEVRYSEDGFISPREVEVNEYIERDLNIHRDRKVGDREFGVYGRPREYYVSEKCIGCTKCAKNCPVSCITGANKIRHVIHSKECIRCGKCMFVCPVAAIVYTNLVHNIETLMNIPDILIMGNEAFKEIGGEKNPGTKIISLEGDVKVPGLIEVPTNATLEEIIQNYGQGTIGEFKGARIGGPIGEILKEDKLTAAIDFETPLKYGLIANVMEGTSLYIIAGKTSIMDLAKASAAYGVLESCGKCTPCREGTKRMEEILSLMEKGTKTETQFEQLATLARIMEDASLCALGQLAPTTIKSILTHFKEDL